MERITRLVPANRHRNPRLAILEISVYKKTGQTDAAVWYTHR